MATLPEPPNSLNACPGPLVGELDSSPLKRLTTNSDPGRVRSSREIDILLSKTVFWDERDRSTWHQDYPDMMLSQYTELVNLAEAHGENFVHGEKIFEKYVGCYRKSQQLVMDEAMPSTSHGQSIPMTQLHSTQSAGSKGPRPILAKFIATRQSVLPSLKLNITEPFTSWGRGYANTVVYCNGYEDCILGYAFKLVLWKRGPSASDA